jgi:hypothetical protein
VCAHKKKREKREKKRKREKDPRQGKKDIKRDDKSNEVQEKCGEGCDDVENESSIFHTMCNPTSRTSLVPCSHYSFVPLHMSNIHHSKYSHPLYPYIWFNSHDHWLGR